MTQPKQGNTPLAIERRIYIIRGQEVMLDSDLAELYQIETKFLNLGVRRNTDRFPEDFMFKLTSEEFANLRLQIATSSLRSQSAIIKNSYGGRRYLPNAFTEHGVAMLSSVLNSKKAIQMNIFIIRAFIQLRRLLGEHKNLSARLNKVEVRQKFHEQILTGMAIDIKLMKNPIKTNAIGFQWRKK